MVVRGEGLPAVVLGVLALRVLTDSPEQADWLPPAQRAWLVATLRRDQAARVAHHEARCCGRSSRLGCGS